METLPINRLSRVPSDDAQKPERPMTQEEEFVWEKTSSVFNYWAGYFSNTAIVLFLFSRAFVSGNTTPPVLTIISVFVLGLLGWTLIEYWLHRTLYHIGETKFVIGHLMHHEAPKALLGVPYYVTAVVYIPLYYGLTFFFDPAILGIAMSAIWLGYIGYCAVHHGTHHWKFKNKLFKYYKAHHIQHHHCDNRNFGITLPLWDYVFFTKKG